MDLEFYDSPEEQSQRVWLNRIFAKPFSSHKLNGIDSEPDIRNADLDPAMIPTRIWYKMPEHGYEFGDSDDTSGASSLSEESSSESEPSDSDSDSDDYTSDEDMSGSSMTSCSPISMPPSPPQEYDGEINHQIPSTVFDLINNNNIREEGDH